MINNAMEGLFRIKNNHAEPGLATKTKVSKDGLTYTMTLRKMLNGQMVIPSPLMTLSMLGIELLILKMQLQDHIFTVGSKMLMRSSQVRWRQIP